MPGEGPEPIEGDGWDWLPPEEGIPAEGAYQGVRRAPRPKTRVLVSGVLAVLSIGAALAVRPMLAGGGPVQAGAGAPPRLAGGPSSSAASDQIAMATGAGPVSTTTTTRGSSAVPSAMPVGATGDTGATSVDTSPPVTFVDVSFEAEAGPPDSHLRGGAAVVTVAGASGGGVVRGIGNWPEGTGSVRFRPLTMPAGTYRIVLSYQADASSAGRTVLVEVGPVTATATFAGGSGCCAVSTVDITITVAAEYAVTLENPDGGVPPIDKIAIARL